jgi:molecular chaperone DnaJ
MPKDYYKTLGIEKTATAEEVKAAFRRLALEHHPDRGGNAEKFKEANEAYQVLSDASKRSQYDRFGSVPENGGGFGGQGFNGFNGQGFGGQGVNINMEDLGDIFGGFGDLFGASASRERSHDGRDISIDAKIDFHDAVFGIDYSTEIMKPNRCSHCSGTGGEPGAKQETCPTCRGAGRVMQNRSTMFGVFQTASTCPDCRGAGKRFEKSCTVCRGSGVVRERQAIKVRLPAGIDDGNTIRVAGGGEAGERGAASGDLYVKVRVKADPKFDRHGDDILTEVNVAFADAALGTAVPVETVDGQVELKIPAGTQPGTVIKLKNRGVPRLRSDSRGDQLVTVSIEVPKKLTKKQKQLLEELRDIQ